MIDLNLLPPEYGPKKAITIVNFAIIALSFFICLSLLLSSIRLMTSVQDYSLKVKDRENQIEHYRRQVEDIRALAKQVNMLSSRLDLVQELLQEKITWSDKLIELFQCLPQDGARMESLTVEHKQAGVTRGRGRNQAEGQAIPKSTTAYVSGNARSIDKVDQFVARLEDSPTFGNIVFDSVVNEPNNIRGGPPISFRLAVEILSLREILASRDAAALSSRRANLSSRRQL